jgi:hypothetical protein
MRLGCGLASNAATNGRKKDGRLGRAHRPVVRTPSSSLRGLQVLRGSAGVGNTSGILARAQIDCGVGRSRKLQQ